MNSTVRFILSMAYAMLKNYLSSHKRKSMCNQSDYTISLGIDLFHILDVTFKSHPYSIVERVTLLTVVSTW